MELDSIKTLVKHVTVGDKKVLNLSGCDMCTTSCTMSSCSMGCAPSCMINCSNQCTSKSTAK